ncbi:MAG: DUF2283 domain-containing protein [Candidatus Caldarchaeum sp.]|nr:DUF2283 domain-containing protein [Candidatus Caldarchaeum sp.]MDW7977972.1 DUF2283 domain-containing protein [Candidatus Caldarchaeum sp.]MDW8359478.1 DUF2283 domain-containing protein [Candidatus Caldarchaeum sp.]
MEYHVEYDPAADALYIKVKQAQIKETVELADNIIVDIGPEGETIGIEILNYSKTKIDLKQIFTKGIEAAVASLSD